MVASDRESFITRDDIIIHERLTRIETMLEESIKTNETCHERIEEMLDHILGNDKDKLDRITELEQEAAVTRTKLKHTKAFLFMILAPLAAGIIKWFI